MAKRSAKRRRRPDFNMAGVIRDILAESPEASFQDVLNQLAIRYPGETINENSAQVAFYKERRKTTTTTHKRSRGRSAQPAASTNGTTDVTALLAAGEYTQRCGGITAARTALDVLESLQLNVTH